MSVPTRPVGIVSAIPAEIALLDDLVSSASRDSIATKGSLDGREVVIAESGIGKVQAAVVVTRLVERFGCEVIIFTGVAGGLDPALSIGDVVVAERTVQHDAGLVTDRGLQRYQPGHVPFFNPTDALGYPASARLLEVARNKLERVDLPALSDAAGGTGRRPRIVFGTVLTGDQFVRSAAIRRRLHAELDGLATEMEGAAVAQAADLLGVEHIVIRSLSDLAGAESDIDFGRFAAEVARNSATVVRHMLPWV